MEHSARQRRVYWLPASTKLAEQFLTLGQSTLSKYSFFCQILTDPTQISLHYTEKFSKIDLAIQKIIKNLRENNFISLDQDCRFAYRVNSLADQSAEDVASMAIPIGCVAYLSAMQHWGLTNRVPEALHFRVPTVAAYRILLAQRIIRDTGIDLAALPEAKRPNLPNNSLPSVLRGRKVITHSTSDMGKWLKVRGRHMRITTIGQTFLDMIETPEACGGMFHVRDVWREHAKTFLQEIIQSIDESRSDIVKIRAGYFLDEMLGILTIEKAQDWLQYAQKGGSRRLDPTKPLSDNISKKWMLSINV